MNFYGGIYEKWLRIITSIGCLYLDSCMHGAIVPLLAQVQWPHSSNATISDDLPKGTTTFALAATFLSTGLVEIFFSPIAGLLSDRLGLDIVILFGLLCATLKCLLYGLTTLTPLILLINRSLQGLVSACTQTMAMARIRDVYDETSLECTIVTGVAMCKLSFNLFAALFVGELFQYMNHQVFLLFLPVESVLIVCVLLTFRTENFHMKELETKCDGATTRQVDKKKHRSVQWRAIFDVQVMIVSLSFLVMNLGQTAFEPSLAIWVEYVFGEGAVSTAHLLGLCGLSVLLSTVCCSYILGTLSQDLSWIFCIVSFCTAGLPLVLVKFSPSITVASIYLAVYFFGLQAARLVLITMCSTVAVTRYPEAYGLVFSIVNLGWGSSFLIGPLVAPTLFGSYCTVCMIVTACILTALLAFWLRNLDSKDGPNFMDCFCPKALGDDGYQVIASNEDIPFTYEQNHIMIQTIEK